MQVRILQLLGDTLRFRDQSYKELASRSIDADELSRLLHDAERDYKLTHGTRKANVTGLVEHGRRLYRWLDGTEQWLGGLRKDDSLVLHIDVESKLRLLPWELLCEAQFLCANPYHLFTPVHRVGLKHQTSSRAPKSDPAPQNRPLRVLFMAASAEGVEPELLFEEEERMILEITRDQPIDLVVEESGCLKWLAKRIADNYQGHFDVAHFTGHAHQTPDGPRFVLEDEFGWPYEANAREIADAFQGRYPRLLFLSGCETARPSRAGDKPSLAEELIKAGFPAVLGWALPVGDVDASKIASVLYERLAVGDPLARAVAAARQKLLETGSTDWHLLRLYADDTPLTALVTPKNTPARERIKSKAARAEFLDFGSKMEVCSRENFVGRRRLIQRGLRILGSTQGQENYAEGALLTGMGGLGKSSLAARLADRMLDFQRVVIVGALDESALQAELRRQLRDKAVREALEMEEPLDLWLIDILDAAEKPILFIFDDFEKNRQEDDFDGFRPTPVASTILHALARAIRETASPCRIVVTCRYRFELARPFSLGEVPLLTMRDVELQKKLRLLRQFHPKIREELEPEALEVAAGNPRLLDRLYPLLKIGKIDPAGILKEIAKVDAEFREDALLETLVAAQTPGARRLLAIALLIGIPLYAKELTEIIPELRKEYLEQTTATGLLEHFTLIEDQQWYYASPLLAPYLKGTLKKKEVNTISGLAARVLYKTRWEDDGQLNDAIALVTRELALAGGETDIAAAIVEWLCLRWIDRAAYRSVKDLCEDTLKYLEDYRVLHELARAEVVLGDTAEAEEHYRLALAVCPPVRPDSPNIELSDRSALLHNLAGLRLTLGNPEKAMDLWQQSLEIEDQIGNLQGKAATLHEMAGVFADQGEIKRAMELWQQSLEIAEQIGNVEGKAATLNNMAGVLANQGEIEQAMGLWQQSLEIAEQIGDVEGKAATLHNMAGVLAQKGEIEQAMGLWQQSIDIEEQIGNLKGKAATLHNMAWAAGQQDLVDEEMKLYGEAAAILAGIRAWPDLVTVLGNMGGHFALQALWLGLRVLIPADDLLGLGQTVFMEWKPESEAALLLAAALHYLIVTRYEDHPKQDELSKSTASLLAACAATKEIAPEQIQNWVESERLTDPDFFMPALDKALRERIPQDSWMFDTALFDTE